VINELALTDTGGFHSFLHMSPSTYDDLLRLVEPHITENDTFVRDAIMAHEKFHGCDSLKISSRINI